MEQRVEREITLANVSVQLVIMHWEGIEDMPAYTGYRLSQRLSEDHSPLRIGNLSPPEVLPRVRAVGLLPPGRSIRMLAIEKPLRIIYCVFDESWFENATGIPRSEWESLTHVLASIKNQRLEVLMQEIYAELEQPDFGSERLIEAVCNLIVVELARHARKLARKRSCQETGPALAPWQLRRILDRIRHAPERDYPGLGELAGLCGISQGHLARAFKASTGWQLHKYIAQERVNVARDLLVRENMSCEEISAKLGFNSAAYFSTVFRRMTGKTPTEFRRLARAGKTGKSG